MFTLEQFRLSIPFPLSDFPTRLQKSGLKLPIDVKQDIKKIYIYIFLA